MSLRCFKLLIALYLLSTIGLAAVVYWQTEKVDGLHFAIDTMTFRGRIPDPPDEDIRHPWVFRATEDIASLMVFVIFGFGISFHIKMIETIVARRQFVHDRTHQHLDHHKSWKEWLRERDPAIYEEYYGSEKHATSWLRHRWLGAKRWLMELHHEHDSAS